MNDFRKILTAFDEFLEKRGESFEATIIGGAALHLLGVTARVTKDCDVLEPTIPAGLRAAAVDFAKIHGLAPGWLNNGPETLIKDLPGNWREERQIVFTGKALKLFTLSKRDLLGSKLFAFLDRGIDLQDIKSLKPSDAEIDRLIPWLKERDGNPSWPEYVDLQIADLKKELYGTK